MGTKEGQEVIRRLVPFCDVVVENFSPRVMKRWGLGYEELKALRKDIIMARLPAFGLSGFQRDYLGMASVAMSITGLYHLWSYPDDPEPAGPPVWTPDYLSAAMGSVAIMAALRHRDRTGEGQLIELAQTEAMAAVLGTEYLGLFRQRDRIPAFGQSTCVDGSSRCVSVQGQRCLVRHWYRQRGGMGRPLSGVGESHMV